MLLLGTAVFGAIGAMLRFYLSQRIKWQRNFPMATLIINISGSAMLGLLFGLHELNMISSWLWQWFGVGLLGAFTTFSTFSYELYTLIKQNRMLASIIYLLSTVLGGIFVTFCGVALLYTFYLLV